MTIRAPRLPSLVTALRVLPLALLAVASALAQAGGEPHLAALPRTAGEADRIAAVTAPATDFSAPEPFEGLPAGAATVRARTDADSFSQASAKMGFSRAMDFKLGNALFRRDWVSAPVSTLASDGLGPHFNNCACQSCHVKDGRGHAPAGPGGGAGSIILRVSVPGGAVVAGEAHGSEGFVATDPDPV